MMKRNFIGVLFFLFTGVLVAQNQMQKKEITQHYNLEKANIIKERFSREFSRQQHLIDSISRVTGQPKKIYNEDGTFMEAVGVFPNGQLKYLAMHNADAARSTRAVYLYPGGGLGLSVEGQGMNIGIWDGSEARLDHQEFTDGAFDFRISSGDNAGWTTNSNHSTHVAGTMGAYGVDPAAKGMAPKCNIISYSWVNDETEVAIAAQNGLLLSNHSYGVPVSDGNGGLQVPDWYPGKYISDARDWDVIAYNFPYYLMVNSAGNEGNFNYAAALAPGYDKLTGNSCSKNNLVVANAQDASIDTSGNLIFVDINSSSSQGPTDDLRIKPDITGNGTAVYSSVATTATSYASFTGTSMSSPNVAGTLLLLQEYYNNKHSSFMLSATLKGLACHTADDAGNPGPDAVFGWGLLNAKKAAETIMGDLQPNSSKTALIQELTLNQGGTYSITVTASGTEPLKASITWTDVPGTVNNDQVANSYVPALVNNLDISVSNGSNTFLPWKLDILNATGNAVTGVNNVDNVERVDVENASGTYTINISHQGTITNGSQDYSLVITGIQSVLGKEDFKMENGLSIWPNPTDENINFILDGSTFADTSIRIYDLNGRLVKSFEEIGAVNNFSADIGDFAPGLYIVKITNGASTYTKKIIKK